MSEQFPPIEWADGYPTNGSIAELQAVNRTACGPKEAARYLRQELEKCAANCVAAYKEVDISAITKEPCVRLHFSTGGWSGAEDLMAVLLSKFWISRLHYQWNRGGHYIFEVPA